MASEVIFSSLLLIICTLTYAAGKLTPIYDHGNQYKLFEIGMPLVLECQTDANPKLIEWFKGDEKVLTMPSFKGRAKIAISGDKSSLSISSMHEKDSGEFKCELSEDSYEFEVWAEVTVEAPNNLRAEEGKNFTIKCEVNGTKPMISWTFQSSSQDDSKPLQIANTSHYLLELHEHIPNAALTVVGASASDEGIFTCIGTNKIMDNCGKYRAESHAKVTIDAEDNSSSFWTGFLAFFSILLVIGAASAMYVMYKKRQSPSDYTRAS